MGVRPEVVPFVIGSFALGVGVTLVCLVSGIAVFRAILAGIAPAIMSSWACFSSQILY